MEFHFKVKANTKRGQKKDKDFWLAADSEKELYKRAAHQYGIDIKEIEIIEVIKDEDIKI